jgi:MFS transporter, DHA1 family, inner membrane transport protein
MSSLFARIALLAGNFVTAVAVIGLAGMLTDLADGLGVAIQTAGLLVTAGAVVLCAGSPLTVWATSRMDRRNLLAGSLAAVAAGHFASAAAPTYEVLLGLRVVMMAATALFTPVAASTIALLVPPRERAGGIAFVFLGFSLAMAAGLPAVAFLSARLGWRAAFALVGVAALACAGLVLRALPRGLRGAPISPRSWAAIARNRFVLLLLLLSAVQVTGQFLLFTYLGPLVTRLGGGGVGAIGAFFSLFGVMGFAGNVLAARLVGRFQPFRTTVTALLSILLGFALWSVGAGSLAIMGTGIAFWGLGFAAVNSMQQARLVAAVPDLASAAVALNTSAIYVGQAIGSALGGALFARGLLDEMGYAAVGFSLAGLVVLAMTRRGPAGAM